MNCMYVWMRLKVYMSFYSAFFCEANVLYWKNSERQNSTPLKHKNTKTALNNLPKNHWVIALVNFLGFVRKIIFSRSCCITLYLKSSIIFMICTSYHKSHNTSHHTKSPAGIGGSAKAPRTPRKRRRDGKSNFIVCSLAATT